MIPTDPHQIGADVHFPRSRPTKARPPENDDDMLLSRTPEDVTAILGFDPLELRDNRRMAEDDDGRWITIGSKATGGGTHVKIDDDGTIMAGPSDLEGKSLDDLGESASKSKETEEKGDKKPFKPLDPVVEKPLRMPLTRYEEIELKIGVTKLTEEEKAELSQLLAQRDAERKTPKSQKEHQQQILEGGRRAIVKGKIAKPPKELPRAHWACAKALLLKKQVDRDVKKMEPYFQRVKEAEKKWLAVGEGNAGTIEGAWNDDRMKHFEEMNAASLEAKKKLKTVLRRYGGHLGQIWGAAKKGDDTPDVVHAYMLATRQQKMLNEVEAGDPESLVFEQPWQQAAAEHEAEVRKAIDLHHENIRPEVLKDYYYKEWMQLAPEHVINIKQTSMAIENAESARDESETTHKVKQFSEKVDPAIAKVMERLEKAKQSDLWKEEQLLRDSFEMLDKAIEQVQDAIESLKNEQWNASSLEEANEIRERRRAKLKIVADMAIEQSKLRDKAMGTARERGLNWLAECFPLEKPGKIDFVFPGKDLFLDGRGMEGLNHARRLLEQVFAGEITVRVFKLTPERKGRAFCLQDSINIQPNESAEVIAHEVGHAIDHSDNDRIGEWSKAFMWRRVRNAKDKTFKHVQFTEPHEVGCEDDFITRYMGKHYSSRGSSEILSSGLEWLCRDAVDFAHRDPEHFAYTIAAVQRLF